MKKVFALIVMATIPFVVIESAYACKCAGPGIYDAVFEGSVTSVEPLNETGEWHRAKLVKFSVSRWTKGAERKEVAVRTKSVALCGANFEVGHRYRVFAIGHESLETKYCFGTVEIE